jgi:hypothetical protein
METVCCYGNAGALQVAKLMSWVLAINLFACVQFWYISSLYYLILFINHAVYRSPFWCQKKLKIMFCGISSTENCLNWSSTENCLNWSKFVLYSLTSIIWYQKYISPMLHWNFTSQNRRKIGPKMRPEVVICDFSYHSTLIMLHTCFQCVLLNEVVLSSHSLRYSKIIVHFYVR